jgi:hypothetical protein
MRTPKTQMPLKLDPKLVERFRAKCRETGRTQTGTVKLLIQKWLDGKVNI